MYIKLNWKDIHQSVNYSYLWLVGAMVTFYSLYFLQNFLLARFYNKYMSQSGSI